MRVLTSHLWVAAALLSVVMVSCSREEPEEQKKENNLNVNEWENTDIDGDATMQMDFRVGDSIAVVSEEPRMRSTTTIAGTGAFEEDDIVTIGVSGSLRDTESKNYAVGQDLTDLTYAGTNATDAFCWKSQAETVNIRAWSYGGGVADADTPLADPNGQVLALETNQQANGYRELLYSPSQTISYLSGSAGISLPMYHQLSRVVVTLTRKASDDASTVSSVTIGDGTSELPTKARFAVPTGSNTAGTWTVTERTATTITPKMETANSVYSAVLIPDTYAEGTRFVRVTTSDGSNYVYTIGTGGMTMQAGCQYNLTISLGNDVATLDAVYPTEWTASGFPVTSYNANEQFGVYVRNSLGEMLYSNVAMPATTSGSTVSLNVGSLSRSLSTSYTYFIYYPYRSNPGTVTTTATTASDFFAGVISGWTTTTSQGTTDALRANDLQVGMITGDGLKTHTLTAAMAHKMGLARFTLASTANVPTTITYLNNTESSRTGSNTVTASSSFSGFTPYNGSGTYLYLVRPSVSTTLNSTTGTDQWQAALTYNITAGNVDTQEAKSRRYGWPATGSAIWSYSSGTAYTFTIPCDGNYFMECWGAAGGTSADYGNLRGSGNPANDYGRGAYTSGTIGLLKTDNSGKLYVYVGGVGTNVTTRLSTSYAGGFNGGGDGVNDSDASDSAGGGGGATDIRLTNSATAWSSRIMVAGGGGGANQTNSGTTNYIDGMHGGAPNISATISGWIGTWTATVNQSAGYQVGQGQTGRSWAHGGGGGGGGYMGGYSGPLTATASAWELNGKASGGSSFVSGATSAGCSTVTVSSKSYTFSNPVFMLGTSSSCPSTTIGGSAAALGKVGGHARITFTGN